MPAHETHPGRQDLRAQLERLEDATARLERELDSTGVDPTRIAALTAVVNGRAAVVSAHARQRR